VTGRGRPLGSTYRLQLPGLGFAGARSLVGYLHALGVETLYLSPVTAAVPGSTHGYDVVDPTRLDPGLGTEAEFEALLSELARCSMRALIDAVPNHMAADPADRWWDDVLARGPSSAWAPVFDIDWGAGAGRVLVATLPAPLGELVAGGRVRVHDGALLADGQRFPLAPPGAGEDEDPAAVLSRQHYRLSFWRLARAEGNYRRFFDIDHLIGVRVEDPAVYERTHPLLLELASDPRVAGLRVDHVDGLADPAGYLVRLRGDIERRRSEGAAIVVEKILGPGEELRRSWPVDGTTGYEFADLTTRLLVDPDGVGTFDALGAGATGDGRPFGQLAVEGRRLALAELFPGQLEHLVTLGRAALDESHPGIDLAGANVRAALVALVTHLDVYRTYITDRPADATDRGRLERAAMAAFGELAGEDARALRTLVGLLAGEWRGSAASGFVVLFQQLSGAVAAKGVEDTACYRTSGLLASAEVGGDPERPALTTPELHQALAVRARRAGGGLNGLSTHDSKRSADVRARLAALSEVPTEWARLVAGWRSRFAPGVEAAGGPDPHDELFLYQSVVGLWPPHGAVLWRDLGERLDASMLKAVREAKLHTSWLDPNPAYESAMSELVYAVLGDRDTRAELDGFLSRIGPAAATNSLAMTVLAATAPGVPDLYQGSEGWQLALMDPDNRRPVDFAGLAAALESLPGPDAVPQPAEIGALLGCWTDGRVKLWVTAAALRLRRRHRALFASRSYLPLRVRGAHHDRVVAFARRRGRSLAIAVVPRLPFSVAGPARFPVGADAWGDTALVLPDGSPSRFVEVLSGAQVGARRGALGVGEALSVLPVAILHAPG
jgi:(1->4)-alpha-D-glucan 1-alpha-D-glucosylmutase